MPVPADLVSPLVADLRYLIVQWVGGRLFRGYCVEAPSHTHARSHSYTRHHTRTHACVHTKHLHEGVNGSILLWQPRLFPDCGWKSRKVTLNTFFSLFVSVQTRLSSTVR